MCGFVGQINISDSSGVKRENIYNSIITTTYRGPDNTSVLIKNDFGLGFNRLKIIDLDERANQPMCDASGDYYIVFNGEIYNFKILRKELKKKNHQFLTESDTEVLLRLYIEYGSDCLQKLNGMFSFLIIDQRRNTLFMARDRTGKKPLFYSFTKHSLLIASEIKNITSFPEFSDYSISETAFIQYLSIGYITSPASIFKYINKVKPGHYVETSFENLLERNLEQRKYWEVDFTENQMYMSIHEWSEDFRTLLRDSINLRLNADVPLALFLSGGMDSSVLAIEAGSQREKIKAFTINFDFASLSELGTVDQLVKKFPGIIHHTEELTANSILEDMSWLNNLDEPLSDSSIIPTYWISKIVRSAGYTVALSGDGGDELFAGYLGNINFSRYDRIKKALHPVFRQQLNSLLKKSSLLFHNNKLYKHLFLSTLNNNDLYWQFRSALKVYSFNQYFNKDFHEKYGDYINYGLKDNSGNNNITLYKAFEENDFRYRLADGFLTKVDRASMYNSLEIRCPFLDVRIIDSFSKLPRNYKLDNNSTKKILRKAFSDDLPPAVLNQPKMGFSIPMKNWIHGELWNKIQATIKSSRFNSLLQPETIQYLFDKGNSSNQLNMYTELIWRMYIMSLFETNYNITYA